MVSDMPGLRIYSNDGQTELYSFEGPTRYNTYKVTSTGLSGTIEIDGAPITSTIYTYSGSGTFAGFSLSANANTATYSNGATISASVTSDHYAELYVVDGTAAAPVSYEHILLNGNKVQVDSAIRDGNGVKIDTNYAKKADLATVATSGSYNDLKNKPNIPAIPSITVTDSQSGNAVTDVTASGHKITLSRGKTFSEVGHTHSIANVTGLQDSLDGKYVKPSGGIPKSDLASAVQTSLGKADTALQSHQDISGKSDVGHTHAISDVTNLQSSLNGKLDDSQLITALSSTASDTAIMSEKLVRTELGKKVTAESGKGLSTNDYTTADKNKLAGIAAGAEVNVQSDWNATSGDAFIKNKPTALSSFTNDSGFITKAVSDLTNYYTKSNTYTKTEVNNLISTHLTLSVVSALPTSNISTTTIYLVPGSDSATSNAYDEYVYTNNAWEKIGTTVTDLTPYAKTADVNAALGGKVDKLSTSPAGNGFVKVNVNAQGQVTGHSAMAESDIPTLSISKIDGLQGALNGKAATFSVTDSNPTLAWGTKSKVATVAGTAINVTMPANPNTDTMVTAVGNHYAPAADSNAELSASASGATAAWSIDVVKGVTLSRDAKGHVTGISVASGKIPANPNTDTKVTSAANHYAPVTVSGQDKTASASGATAAWSIDVVKGVTLNTDGKGHVTGLSVTSGKIPANPTTGLVTGVSSVNTKTGAVTLGAGDVGAAPAFTVETTGSGNAVTAVSYANNKITATKGTTFLTQHQAIPGITVVDNGTGNAVTDVTASGHTVTLARGKTFSEAGHTHAISDVTNLQTTLDGKIKRGSYERIEGTSSAKKNLNSYTTAGFYNVKGQYTENCPLTGDVDYYLMVMPWNTNNWCMQVCVSGNYGTANYQKMWLRSSTNANGTAWTDWSRLANASDIPTALSQLSADSTHRLVSDAEKSTWNNKSNLAIGTTATTAAAGNHTHPASIVEDSTSTVNVTLAHNKAYKLTAGGTSVVFKTPTDNNSDTKNTAGSTNSTSKLFLIGATSQAANPQTYSNENVYATDGTAFAKAFDSTALDSGGANFRAVGGNYGYIIRNDGSNTYGLMTASGDKYGSWTSARPWTINNSTGVMNINGNAATATKATQDVDGNAIKTTYAKLASPALTGTPTAPTAQAGTNSTQIATTAFVMNAFQANDAMIFKGTVNAASDLPATHYQGWTYKVATAGAYLGQNCEVGDMIICVTDGTAANNAHWAIIQNNIDGAVTGPASATGDRFASFNGTTGKIIKDSGYSASSFATAGHTHNYAGSSSAGGAATSANKLNTNAGSGTQPVYFSNGVPVATTYALNKTVPSDAKFTDTLMTQDVSESTSYYPILACPTSDAKVNQGAKTGLFSKSIVMRPASYGPQLVFTAYDSGGSSTGYGTDIEASVIRLYGGSQGLTRANPGVRIESTERGGSLRVADAYTYNSSYIRPTSISLTKYSGNSSGQIVHYKVDVDNIGAFWEEEEYTADESETSTLGSLTLNNPDTSAYKGYFAAKALKGLHIGHESTFSMPAATTRCKLFTISKTDYANNHYTAHLKFRIWTGVNNPYMNFTADIHYSGTVSSILIYSANTSVTTSAPVRWLSSYVPKTVGAYDCFVMVENGTSTSRAMNIEVLEADVPYTLATGTLAAHGQTDGNFNIDRVEVANNADRVMVTSGRIVTNITGYADGGANWSYYLYNDYWGTAGEYLAGGSIIAKGSDGKAYVLKARTDKVFALPLTVARANSNTNANANCAVQHQSRNLAVSALTSMTADSTAVGAPLYIRGSLDTNGYFICDGHYSSAMANGYTWVQIGSFARTMGYWNLDASQIQHAITLDSSGKVTHVDGKAISMPKITASTSAPTSSDGANGDIWIQY